MVRRKKRRRPVGCRPRTPVRKAAEISAESWLKAGLPKGHGLPSPRVMAGQMALLAERLLLVLRVQQERYARYVEEHPPALAPIHKDAVNDLPLEAINTYHTWLEGVALRREWWRDEAVRFELDQIELSDVLLEALEEAVGTGGEAARRALGALRAGFTPVGQVEAQGLLKELAAYASSNNLEAQAIYQAIADRAAGRALRAAVLRDGAGRVVGAVSYRTVGDVLVVGHLGAVDGAAPGTGVQLVRELAGIAAKEGKGITLAAPLEAQPFFSGLGFAPDAEGGLRLAAQAATTLAEGTGPLPGWVRVGWLQGSTRTFEEVTGDVVALEAELAESWEIATANFGQAQAALANFKNRAKDVALENMTAEEAASMHLYTLRAKDGSLDAVALMRETAGKPLYGDRFGARPGRTGAGREMMRNLANLDSARENGFVLNSTESAEGFYARLGMTQTKARGGWTGAEYYFKPEEARAFASGLTGESAFAGQISWELAVAGASDWLRNHKIPGVVDEVSKTTHKALVDALAYGLERGESTQQLAYRVRQLDNVFGPVRAERIARTEVITANRAGGYQMGKEAGCQEHEWRSRVESTRTRDWHRGAHKQRVPYDQPYTVYNRLGEPQQLMYPGDTSLGAGPDNVIQCRCSERHIKPGVTDDETLGIHEHGLADGPAAPGPVVAGTPGAVAVKKHLPGQHDQKSHGHRHGSVADDERWEKERQRLRGLKAEQVVMRTASGKVLRGPIGTDVGAEWTPEMWAEVKGSTILHNHPRDYDLSFSPQDMLWVKDRDHAAMEVISPSGALFRVEPGAKGWPDFHTVQQAYIDATDEADATVDDSLPMEQWGPAQGAARRTVNDRTMRRLQEAGWIVYKTTVQKDKGWAPGPNAGWKRKDDDQHWLSDEGITPKIRAANAEAVEMNGAYVGLEGGPFAADWPKEYTPDPDAPGQDKETWKVEGSGIETMTSELVPMEDLLEMHGNLPRHDDASVQALAESLAKDGALEPVMLYVGADDHVYIGEGNHRIEAARRLGWTHFPARLIMNFRRNAAGGVNGNILTHKWKVKRGDGYQAEYAPPSAYLDLPGIVRRDDVTFDEYMNPTRVQKRVVAAFADAVLEAIAKDKGWMPGPNAGWRRRNEEPDGPSAGPATAEGPKRDAPATTERSPLADEIAELMKDRTLVDPDTAIKVGDLVTEEVDRRMEEFRPERARLNEAAAQANREWMAAMDEMMAHEEAGLHALGPNGEVPEILQQDAERCDALCAASQEANKALYDFDAAHYDRAKTTLEVLSEIRPMGGEPRIIAVGEPDAERLVSVIKEGAEVYPTAWMDRTRTTAPVQVYGDVGKDGRAYYDGHGGVHIGSGGASIARHELGHHFEETNAELSYVALNFYEQRTLNDDLVPLGRGYRADEFTRKDKFFNKYAGKDYRSGATEILSMGAQYLFGGYREQEEVWKKDPEYAKFIIGVLAAVR